MAVNLTKHRTELQDAWKDVVDDKTSTDWALFGYEKQSNNLFVVEKGDGGLEELIEEFNSGKIMYAFCRVVDPNTGLPKFVFINWQGEGAPVTLKGTCANHVREVSNFFKGAHITVNARMEEDVEPEIILEKVGKASASVFNFKDRSDPVENITPVGSVYKRILPTREINPVEREKFWVKEQEEEKKRIVDDRKKAEEDRRKLEQERKDREIRDTSARDEWVKERSRSINQMREAAKNAENAEKSVDTEKVQWERQLEDDAKDEKERRVRSESLRRERSHEAQNLISKRTINARAIFEQNSYAGQMSGVQTSRQPKVLQDFEESQARSRSASSPIEESSYFAQYEKEEVVEPVEDRQARARSATSPIQESSYFAQYEKEQDIEPIEERQEEVASPVSPREEFSYTKNLLKEGLAPRLESEIETNIEEEEQNWDEPTLEAPPNVRDPLTEMMAEHGMVSQPLDNTQVITSSQISDGLRARALYDYQAADETEISFDPDDVITQIEQIDEGWWQGLAPDGLSYGLFPANYVELID